MINRISFIFIVMLALVSCRTTTSTFPAAPERVVKEVELRRVQVGEWFASGTVSVREGESLLITLVEHTRCMRTIDRTLEWDITTRTRLADSREPMLLTVAGVGVGALGVASGFLMYSVKSYDPLLRDDSGAFVPVREQDNRPYGLLGVGAMIASGAVAVSSLAAVPIADGLSGVGDSEGLKSNTVRAEQHDPACDSNQAIEMIAPLSSENLSILSRGESITIPVRDGELTDNIVLKRSVGTLGSIDSVVVSLASGATLGTVNSIDAEAIGDFNRKLLAELDTQRKEEQEALQAKKEKRDNERHQREAAARAFEEVRKKSLSSVRRGSCVAYHCSYESFQQPICKKGLVLSADSGVVELQFEGFFRNELAPTNIEGLPDEVAEKVSGLMPENLFGESMTMELLGVTRDRPWHRMDKGTYRIGEKFTIRHMELFSNCEVLGL